MKFSCVIQINLPIDKVVSLWNDEENFINWQDGFSRIELLEGEKGRPGAISKLIYFQYKGSMELLETIIENNLPEIRKARYEHVQMVNTQTIKMKETESGVTEITSEIEYTKFKGAFAKFLALFFPKMFKKQVDIWLNDFKTFAEVDSLNFQ